MTKDELEKLVAKGENETVEFKETTGQRGEGAKTLCAFLNGNGGTLVFGVSRKGLLQGQLVSDETKRDLAATLCEIEPGVEIPIEFVDVDEMHQAIVCRVEKGLNRPYAFEGRPYRRVQSTTRRMPQEQYDSLLSGRRGYVSSWELQSDPRVSLSDLDLDEVRRTAHIAVSEGRLSSDVDLNDPKDLLRRFGLLKGDRPFNGAFALFGKDLTFYPQCRLQMAWFKGADKTIFLDNRLAVGGIVQLQSEAMAFCFKHLNLSGVVKGIYREEKLEIPAEALREAIINALAHRIYDGTGAAVSLAIYEDRVEISNPGRFAPDTETTGIVPGIKSTPRNPTIARVLYLRKAIEMWGRGISLIVNACRNAHIKEPVIREDKGFVTIVFTRPTQEEWINGTDNREAAIDEKALPKGTTKRDYQKETTKRPISEKANGHTGKGALLVLEAIRADPTSSIQELAKVVGIGENGIRYHIRSLKKRGMISRIGGLRYGHWDVQQSLYARQVGQKANVVMNNRLDERLGDKLGERLGDKLGERLGDKLGERTDKNGNPIKLSDVRIRILELMEQDARISAAAVANKVGYSLTAIEKNIEFLKANGFIRRHGADFGGYWEVIR